MRVLRRRFVLYKTGVVWRRRRRVRAAGAASAFLHMRRNSSIRAAYNRQVELVRLMAGDATPINLNDSSLT